MKKTVIMLLAAAAMVSLSCKDENRFVEPNFVLTKWAGAVQNLNYRDYAACEAYPKSEATFREMYRNYYIIDIMATDIEDADKDKVRTDQAGNRYMHRMLDFEGTIVNRQTRKATGVMRGNTVFVKFLDGRRSGDGWLMSNRTLIPVPR